MSWLPELKLYQIRCKEFIPSRLTHLPYATRILSCFGPETARLLMLSGARELARDARASTPDELINSLIGGIASGGLVGRLEGYNFHTTEIPFSQL